MHSFENWDDLRFFLAVARGGGLSAAARYLRVNQSTVYRRIGQLEEALGASLFDRQARGYSLNSVGEHMLGLAEQVEEDVLALGRAVQGADNQLRGTVRITTVLEIFSLIVDHVATFRAQHPGIDLQVDTQQRVVSLSRREADIAIRPGDPPTEPDVIGRKLMPTATAFYASAAYLKGRRMPASSADLAAHDLISFPIGRNTPPGASDHNVVFRADSMSAQAMAARAGIGIALLPRFMGDRDDELVSLFEPPSDRTYNLWLLIHADLRQTARVRAFIDFITEAVGRADA